MTADELGLLLVVLRHKAHGFYLVEAPDEPSLDDLTVKIRAALAPMKRTGTIPFTGFSPDGAVSVTRFVQTAVEVEPNTSVFFLRHLEGASSGDPSRIMAQLNYARENLFALERNFLFLLTPDMGNLFRRHAPDLFSWIPHKYAFASTYIPPRELARSVQLEENVRFKGDRDRKYLKELIDLYERQLAEAPEDDAYRIPHIVVPLADLYEEYGDYERELPLRQRIHAFYVNDPLRRAEELHKLGNNYLNFPKGSRAENIEKSIRCYKQSLEVRTRENMPVLWAATMVNIANAYQERIQGSRSENLEKAIHCYEQVLEVTTRESMIMDWARVIINLANAYQDRISGDRAENIEKAIRYSERALGVITRESMPVQWAGAMVNLSNAYADRIRGERAENLEAAIRYSEQALEVITRESMPVQWADATMNLAITYSNRIRGDRAENIEEAIRLYGQAIEVTTHEAMPMRWARTIGNLASAYLKRVQGNHSENIEKAIRYAEQTLEVRNRESFPVEWARTMLTLAIAYQERIRGNRAENIQKAIQYCQDAMEIYQRGAFPDEGKVIPMYLEFLLLLASELTPTGPASSTTDADYPNPDTSTT